MYRILLVKNRYKKKFDYKKGIEHLEKNTPLKFQIDEIETDFDLEFIPIGNDKYSGVVASGYKGELKKVIPENKYNLVCLLYGNKPTGVRVSVCENEPLYEDTDLIQVVINDDGKTLNHEIFHSFFKKLARKGIVLHDPIDKTWVNGVIKLYFNNSSLTAKHSNRTIALEALKPYWDIIEKMGEQLPEVTVTRTYGLKQTTGSLLAKRGGAVFMCHTLELPNKDNQQNISCIPAGVYKCKVTFSPRFMKVLYEVKNVPNRTGILFHAANYVSQLNGCLALGNGLKDINGDGLLDTVNSKVTVDAFMGFMGNKDFTLIVK